jgi:hypothetical protein
MATAKKAVGVLPPELEVFDPARWGPVPGAVLEACRCASCVARWGPELPPDTSTTVGAARRRWRQARVDHLRDVLGKDHPAYRFEVLQQIQEMSSDRWLDDGSVEEPGGVVIVGPPDAG